MVPPVTAERSPPLSRMTGADSPGHRRLVHGGDPLDHLAVAGDDLAGLDHDDVALAQARGGDLLLAAVHQLAGDGLLAEPAQGGGLGLAPALGQRLGEVREDHREPEPEGDLAREPGGQRAAEAARPGRAARPGW